ncbi:adenosylcobinamide-GDP ribazoletransferase [Flammeovirga sp. MY04]|nr:adenosylcobinamide-GDP ribazoletransferase [Flammeovirga sp. MY04]
MMREIYLFFTALQFFTRVPIPKWVPYKAEYLQDSRKYFPFIGILLGAVTCLFFYVSKQVFSVEIAILISMLSSIFITGAFHEDGLADTFDAFGGGYTPEKILTIMKDSRIGTYGTVAVILSLALKFFFLKSIYLEGDYQFYCSLILGHSLSRFLASTMVDLLPYVQDLDISKSKPIANTKFAIGQFIPGLIFGLWPLVFFRDQLVFLILFPSIAFALYLGWYFRRKIGGYTGDCLGATQQMTEIVIYASLVVLWKFI